jgi:hypothetical protein
MQSEYCKKEIPTLDTRIRAIFCCIWFGTMPWQLYENEKHYEYDYWSHLKLNWRMLWVWLTSWKLDAEELEFEHEVNSTWWCVYNRMCAGLR